MSNLIGQSIGRYHILEQLGEGGMATVYKAYDTRLERDVAIKVIRRKAFPEEQLERILKRFEREAKALARLTHTNIVSVIDYGEFEEAPYLVMEYLPSGTLKQRLGQPIPWREAIRILLPIAEALDYAHSQNIIHRDIKPSNILLTQRDQPMLTDFGIAKILESEETQSLTGTDMGIGTPEYMAPEQWTGQSGPQSDIYSLGVVLYELVTGRKPYTADTPAAIMIKQVNDPLPRPRQFAPNLPDKVEKIIIKALAKKPEDRYHSMGEFITSLENLLSGQTTKTGVKVEGRRRIEEEKTLFAGGGKQGDEEETRKVPIPPIDQRPRSIRWRRWAALSGLVVLAVLGTAIGIGFLNQAQKGHVSKVGLATRTSTQTSSPSTTFTISYTPTEIATQTILPSLTFTPEVLSTRTPGRPIIYILQVGEFPLCIARRFNVDPNDLLAQNGMSSGQQLPVGVALIIPQTGSFPGNTAMRPHPTTYIVVADDNINSVACYFGDVYPEDIIFQNKITPPYSLYPGQLLQIP